MLLPFYQDTLIEAGCDEVGRGCLAGPVVAAAVILPPGYSNPALNDSKKLSARKRSELSKVIMAEASDYGIGIVDNIEIDHINISRASIKAMHLALSNLKMSFDFILVDGNRFYPYKKKKHVTIIKGDGKYMSIAAASIIAKVYRDDLMCSLGKQHPEYLWHKNVGYPTKDHRTAIKQFGITGFHRKSFRLLPDQLDLF